MCLAIPGRLIDVTRDGDVRMGRVDFGGVERRVCLETLPEVAPGEYVLVHVGFALSRIDEEEATRLMTLLAELGEGEPATRDPAAEPSAGDRG